MSGTKIRALDIVEKLNSEMTDGSESGELFELGMYTLSYETNGLWESIVWLDQSVWDSEADGMFDTVEELEQFAREQIVAIAWRVERMATALK